MCHHLLLQQKKIPTKTAINFTAIREFDEIEFVICFLVLEGNVDVDVNVVVVVIILIKLMLLQTLQHY